MKAKPKEKKYKKELVVKITYKGDSREEYKQIEKIAKKGETEKLTKIFNKKLKENSDKEKLMEIEINNYKTILEQFQETMKNKDVENFQLKQRFKDLERTGHQSNQEQLESFKQEIIALKKERESLQDELNKSRIDADKLRDSLTNSEMSQRELESYKTKYLKMENESLNLRNSIHSGKIENEAPKLDQKVVDDMITFLEKEISTLQEELQKKDQELNDMHKTKYSNSDELKKKESEITKLKNENSDLKEIITKKEKEIEKYKKVDNNYGMEDKPSNHIILENLFLIYLLNRTPTYEKAIDEVSEKFEFYMEHLHNNHYELDDYYTRILDDFIYQTHNQAPSQKLFQRIFEKNYLNKDEIPLDKFKTLSYVTDEHMDALRLKVVEYRDNAFKKYEKLQQQYEKYLDENEEVKKYFQYEECNIFSVNLKGVLRINLYILNSATVKYLCHFIKYLQGYKFSGIEFYGDLKLENKVLCDYIYKPIFELAKSQKENIQTLICSQMKGFDSIFAKRIFNYLLKTFPNIKSIYIVSCSITLQELFCTTIRELGKRLDTLDLSDNNITSLEFFDNDAISDKVILKKNKGLQFRESDKNIEFMYLDLSKNEFEKSILIDFSSCFRASNIQLLNLSNNILDEELALFVGECIYSMRNLKVLFLNKMKFLDNSLNIFSKTNYEKAGLSLLEFYFNDNEFEHKDLETFFSLFIGSAPKLLKVELKGLKLEFEDIKVIAEKLSGLKKLKEINMERNSLKNDDEHLYECVKLFRDNGYNEKIKILI